MNKSAVLSDCGKYRYELYRIWDTQKKLVNFIMLNPSTADHVDDDPTIRRCMGFARDWGFGGIAVTNLFALRTSSPKILRKHPHPTSEVMRPLRNKDTIIRVAGECDLVVAAYGNLKTDEEEVQTVTLLKSLRYKLKCLGRTKTGFPRHPLYLSKSTQLERWIK